MTHISLDPRDFRELIDQAVDAALCRLQAERHRDQAGRLLLGKREAAESLGMSISSLDRITFPRGSLRAVRLDGRVLYSLDSLRAWIAERESAGGQP